VDRFTIQGWKTWDEGKCSTRKVFDRETSTISGVVRLGFVGQLPASRKLKSLKFLDTSLKEAFACLKN